MKWIVGLDLRAGDGPVRFARWLSETSRAPDGEQLFFAHVLEEEHLRFVLRQHHLDEVTEGARAEAARLLAREGARGELRIAQGLTAEDGLEALRAQVGADAVVIGRAAPREGFHVARLGRVARRLLRRLPCPVVVVPPDLRLEEIPEGPIGALTDLAPDALAACRFGGEVAARLGRPLVALHAIRAAQVSYLAASSSDRARDAHAADAATALDAWLDAAALRPQGREILAASPVDGATEWAARARSPLLVAGSRRLSGAERIVASSTGTGLASSVKIAAAIVAP